MTDPDLKADSQSTIDEWLGHAAQLSELEQMGLKQKCVDLLQLAFHSYLDQSEGNSLT